MKGFVQVHDGWITNGLDDGAFRLLCLLAKYARSDGTCHLGTTELARVLKISDREARNRLGTLEEAGHIRREYQDEAHRHLAAIVVPEAKRVGQGADPTRNSHPATPAQTEQECRPDGTDRRNKQTEQTVGTGVPSDTIRERPNQRDQTRETKSLPAGPPATPDLRLVKPPRTIDRPPDVPARMREVRDLTAGAWNERVAAEIEMYAGTNPNVDWAALEYAITTTAADRDRRQIRVTKPYGFIMTEYRKRYQQELPAGPVEPRAAPTVSGGGRPTSNNRPQQAVDNWKRYLERKQQAERGGA